MEKEVSCLNSKVIIDYVKALNKGECSALFTNLDPAIDSLQDPEAFLTDPVNWVSGAVSSELFLRAKTIFKDEDVPYKIAKFAVENASLGYIQKIFVKTFWSIKTALKHVQKINDKLNRTKKIELVEVGKRQGIVRLHWFPHMKTTIDACRYNQGLYTFLPLIWGNRPMTVEESCCFFKGAPYCEYHLKWSATNSFSEFITRFVSSKSMLMETLAEVELDKKIIENKYEEVALLNTKLNQKVNQLAAVHESAKAILSVLDLPHLLDVIMSRLHGVCHIDRAIVMLVNQENEYLEFITGIGIDSMTFEALRDYKIPLKRDSNLLVRVVNAGLPEYIPDVETSNLNPRNLILTHIKPNSAFVVPLMTESRVLGVIATDVPGEKGVPEETRKILEIFAPLIAIAVSNARLFNEIRSLNLNLEEKNEKLEKAYGDLQDAVRKVQILESIKGNLSKFVPSSISGAIEKSPTGSLPESREKDVSVLFLDLEGYTKLTEVLSPGELNETVEKVFSLFIDAIHAYHGDINETAGDGLMVLFMNEDKRMNALQAIRAALAIKKRTNLIDIKTETLSAPLFVNVGISSGSALVGAARFESFTGARWTYTARGMVTNVAARIAALASGGGIYISESTASLVKRDFPLKSIGKFALKNISEQVEIFTVLGD